MRNLILGSLVTIFGAVGGITLLTGIFFTIAGFSERENAIESWFGVFVGLMLIGNAALLITAALLAYIAILVSTSTRHFKIPDRPLAERPVWYQQNPQR